jgi:hypothetical protein
VKTCFPRQIFTPQGCEGFPYTDEGFDLFIDDTDFSQRQRTIYRGERESIYPKATLLASLQKIGH